MCRALHRYTLHILKGHLADIKVVLAIIACPQTGRQQLRLSKHISGVFIIFHTRAPSLDKSDFTCDIFTVFLNTISSIGQSFAAHKVS